MKAIIIEDNEIKAMLIKEYINPFISSIAMVNTLKEALPLLQSNEYEYIFLDHHLPDCKGSEQLQRIKSSQAKAKCVSISNDSAILDEFELLGYDNMLEFPLSRGIKRLFHL
jgi:CheY-like chemotaxis protein